MSISLSKIKKKNLKQRYRYNSTVSINPAK